jgi:hypothetical protein
MEAAWKLVPDMGGGHGNAEKAGEWHIRLPRGFESVIAGAPDACVQDNSARLDALNANDQYRAMDWLLPEQLRIEVELAKRHLSGGTIIPLEPSSGLHGYWRRAVIPLRPNPHEVDVVPGHTVHDRLDAGLRGALEDGYLELAGLLEIGSEDSDVVVPG